MTGNRLGAVKRAVKMDFDGAIPLLGSGLQEWRQRGITRIVHQDINATKRVDGALDHLLHLAMMGHVGWHRDGTLAQAFDFCRRVLGTGFINISDNNTGAFPVPYSTRWPDQYLGHCR